MKTVRIFLLAATILSAASACQKSDTPTTPDNSTDPKLPVEPEAEVTKLTDPANCFVVKASGLYSFDATTPGNGIDTLGEKAQSVAADSAVLIWQSSKGMIKSVSLASGEITFEHSGKKGNALIGALDKDGKILWSWHIWSPKDAVRELKGEDGIVFMNMNLGATKAEFGSLDSYGLLYQWGRKDPFPGSPTLTGDTSTMPSDVYDLAGGKVSISYSSWYDDSSNTLEFATANPTIVLSSMKDYASTQGQRGDWLKSGSSNDRLWGNPQGKVHNTETNTYPNKGFKTMFDPCPHGWHVPHMQAFIRFTSSGGYSTSFDDFNIEDTSLDGTRNSSDWNYGFCFNLSEGISSAFPATGRYYGAYGMLYGSVAGLWGNYWTNAPVEGGYEAIALSFSSNQVGPQAAGGRSDAYAVRCIKD